MAVMGRPKSQNPKTVQISVRLDEADVQKLKENAEHYGENMAQSLRRGILLVNKAIQKK